MSGSGSLLLGWIAIIAGILFLLLPVQLFPLPWYSAIVFFFARGSFVILEIE